MATPHLRVREKVFIYERSVRPGSTWNHGTERVGRDPRDPIPPLSTVPGLALATSRDGEFGESDHRDPLVSPTVTRDCHPP